MCAIHASPIKGFVSFAYSNIQVMIGLYGDDDDHYDDDENDDLINASGHVVWEL